MPQPAAGRATQQRHTYCDPLPLQQQGHNNVENGLGRTDVRRRKAHFPSLLLRQPASHTQGEGEVAYQLLLRQALRIPLR